MNRKMKSVWTIALSVLLVMLMVAGCGGAANTTDGTTASEATSEAAASAGADAAADSKDKIVIGYALKTLQEEFWQNATAELEKVAADHDVELIVQVANGDTSLQVSQIENLMTQGVDVLMISAVDATALTQVSEDARNQGIPLVHYDSDPTGVYADVYIGFDNFTQGVSIVEVLSDMNVDGNYVFLHGDKAGDTTATIVNGEKSVLQERIDSGAINIVAEQWCKDWKAEEAQAHMENALSANSNNIQAVVCMNDGIASGTINALQAQGLAGKVPVTGMDGELTAFQRIVKGTQTSTLFKPARERSIQAIETAIALAKGEKLTGYETINFGANDVIWVKSSGIVVTKDNIDEVVINAGYYTHDDIYTD